MAVAKVTLNLTPTEFELINQALRSLKFTLGEQYQTARGTDKTENAATQLKIKTLMESMGR